MDIMSFGVIAHIALLTSFVSLKSLLSTAKTLPSCFALDPELYHVDILGIPARFLCHFGFYFSYVFFVCK